MQKTENYGFNKPESTDFYNVEDFNAAMDLIDTTLKKIENEADPETAKAHVAQKDNPHEVTAAQVGLGNVPNVSTNNQTPTYTVPSTMSELASGEKLNVAMGKIAKAVAAVVNGVPLAQDAQKLNGKEASEYALVVGTPEQFSFGIGGESLSYLTFARVPNASSGAYTNATLLFTEGGNFGAPVTGAWIIQVSGRNNVPTMTIRTLIDTVDGSRPSFGYYNDTTNGYFYFGVKTTSYRGLSVVTKLGGSSFAEIKNFGVTATEPSGWTQVSAPVLATTADLANYLPLGGGTIGGQLAWLNGWGLLDGDANHINIKVFGSRSDSSTYRAIRLLNSAYAPNGAMTALEYFVCTNGVAESYPILHTGNMAKHVLPLDGSVPMKEFIKIISASSTTHQTALIQYGNETYLRNINPTNGKHSDVWLGANRFQYISEDAIGYDIHHDGNSAKVVVSSTPLTAEGSVRVW